MVNSAAHNGIRMQDSTATVLTVPEAAEFLRVSESIIRRLIRESRIPFFQIEGRYLLYRPALEQWITSRIANPDGRPGEEKAAETANEIWNSQGER